MKKYKNLIILLVVFGSIHLLINSTIIPAITKLIVSQDIESKALLNQLPYFLALLKSATLIIWAPVSIWIYKDSKNGMFSPWLWATLILIANYQGLIIYLLVRLLSDKEIAIESTP
jgi:hypothetical protein